MKSIFLNKKVSKRVEQGHPWVFGNEINRGKALDAAAKPGEIVNVYTHDKLFIGRGYINPQSQIMVRLLTRDKSEMIDGQFFVNRIREAWDYRQKLGYIENCRLIFGEADGIPQLVIDKFNDYFVIQTLAFGIDLWKPAIVEAIGEIFSPKGIYERNDVPVRELEGMDQRKGFLSAEFDTNIIINENGVKYHVDIANGQKTGFFLDQQDNRRAIMHIVKDADVLGAFCYTGSFEIAAAHFGARSVLGLDISQNAIDMCNKNAVLNDVDRVCRFECVNAFDALKEWSKEGKQWDVVMLDPPSFTKSRASIDKAVAGYKEINLRGIKLVKPGGFLVTSSCTNLVQPELFLDIIQMAAHDAKRKIRQVVFNSQSADHPIIREQENTHYLKFLIVQVL
jgi:23S rRNA (cytosine1962-C5)-methyltransferase